MSVFVLFVAVLAPNAAANTGLPLLAVVWPAAWFLFFPIVGVEAVVARKILELPWGYCARIALLANAVSTVVAIPLTWAGLFLISLAVEAGVAPGSSLSYLLWLPPFSSDANYLPPLFSAFLCIPLFATSYFVEAVVTARIWKIERGLAHAWALRANALTYGASFGLALLIALWFNFSGAR